MRCEIVRTLRSNPEIGANRQKLKLFFYCNRIYIKHERHQNNHQTSIEAATEPHT